MSGDKLIPVKITFKKDEKWLHDAIRSKTCHIGWVKDVLKEHLENESKPKHPAIQDDWSILDQK